MSEQNYTLDNISTFVTLPVDTFDSDTLQRSEPLRIIKNAIIKKLPDGSLCIIDANEVNNGLSQIEVTYLPPIQNDLTAAPPLEKSPVNVDNIKNDSKEVPSHSPATPTYKCPRCKEVFNKTGSFKKHLMSHKNMKKFKCDKCSAGYNVETNLKIHMAMHSEGKPSCPICHISFQRTASLKSHLMLHQVEELYTCEDCGAEFDKEEDLNKHLNSHIHNTAKENNSLICHYCNDQFEDYKSYKEHLSFHAKVKKLVLSGKKSRRTHGNKLYPHVCNICSKSFSRVSLLERHLRVHSGEKPFVCQHCNRGFNQKGTLQIHLSKHTGIKPFQCTLCSAKFNQKGNLRVHVQKTHTVPQPGAKVYRCSHCPCIFKKIASLNIHITRFHANHEEIGNNITNVINRLKELEEVATVTPDEKQDMNKNTSCDNIDINKDTSYVRLAESFLDGTVQRYLVMQKKVNDVRWYICSYCNKEFKKPSDLIRHTRVHTKEKPFECNKCGATFSLKTSLYYHSKTHLSNNNNYLCSICLKKFSSVRSVNSHIRKHLEKPQYKCLTCSKWFTSMQKAKIHNKEVHCNQSEKDLSQTVMKQPLLKTSNGLLPVPPPKSNITATKQVYCPICSAKFSKIPNLKRHMLLHNGERKYKCGQCLKSYYTPNGLKEHLSNHSAMKNFGCKVCGKKYATASLLKRHAISHSTNKPYVCPYCSKSFKSLMLCRKHINIHKKDGNIQITHNETNEVQNVNNLDKLHLSVIPDSVSNATNLLINNQSNSTSQLINNNVLVTQPNTSQVVDPSVNIIQTQIDKQLYELSPNSIQIITNSDKDITQDPNQIQTIFINCDDLPLGDNLYTSNADTLLFNSLNDLQETNSFNIESINGNFSTQTTETFNVNQIVTNESTNKITKTNNSNLNTSYYPQSDLNLLFNLDTEFVSNSCDLPNENLNLPDINVNEVPNLNVEQLQENQESKEKSKPLKCEKCNKEFSNKRTFSKHLSCHKDRKKVGGGVHHCSFCQKCFKKHSDLVRHIRTHTGEKPFACDKCEKKFTLKSTLLSHERTHNPVSHKQFSCVVCNSFFTSKSSLKVHMSIHTGDKTHKCNFCSIKFRTAAHRKSHENNYHLNPPKKQTKNKVTNLLASVAMDVLNQPEQVGLQNDQIVTGGDLENVLVVQEPIQLSDDQLNLLNEPNQNTLTESTQLEPLILQQLQSNFISSLIQLDDGTLLNVKAINTEDETTGNVSLPVQKPRNLECDICNKKYASKEVLRKHKKIHGIDKKFRCSQCLKGFDGKEDFDMHQKTHEGLRPYPCFYCANSFSKQQSLTTHLKRIHNVSFTKDNSLLCDLK